MDERFRRSAQEQASLSTPADKGTFKRSLKHGPGLRVMTNRQCNRNS